MAVAHTFWMHSVRAEIYTVFIALMVLELSVAIPVDREDLLANLCGIGFVRTDFARSSNGGVVVAGNLLFDLALAETTVATRLFACDFMFPGRVVFCALYHSTTDRFIQFGSIYHFILYTLRRYSQEFPV